MAIGIINADPTICRVLVICPAGLKINWRRELTRWLTRPLTVGIADSKMWPSTDIVICNYDIVHKFTKQLSFYWDLVICDESHYIKNSKTRRAQAIVGHKPSRQEESEGKKVSSGIPAKRKLCLTGTPILNRPIELFTVLNWLAPSDWPNLFKYAIRYCAAHNSGFGWDMSGASNLEELQTVLRRTVMVRRLKADVLTELPAKRRMVIEIPAEGCGDLIKQENEQYAQWEERISAFKARVELAKVSDSQADYAAAVQALREGMAAAFEDGARVAHEIALKKVPFTVEHVKEIIEEGHKVVVFARHLDAIAALQQAFGATAVKFTGEMANELRQKSVDRFQKDTECKVFIGSDAATEGLTLTASSRVVFHELDWVPGKMSQREDRLHRIGQKDSVLVQHLVLEGSLDARKAVVLIEKQEIIDRALDRPEEAREIASEPVVPIKSVSVTLKEVEVMAKEISQDQAKAIHMGLRMLAGMDGDKARDLNGMGFSKIDVAIGHSLAGQCRITAKQGVLGLKLLTRYKKQLPSDLLTRAGVKVKGEA